MTPAKGSHGTLDSTVAIAGTLVPCYVLNDRRRILAQRPLLEALGLLRANSVDAYIDPLAALIRQEPFASQVEPVNFQAWIGPVSFISKDGRKCCGYDATAVIALCQMINRCIGTTPLTIPQQRLLARSQVLIRFMPADSLLAAIDNATGYRRDQDRKVLHDVFRCYMTPSFAECASRFPDEFYRELFRLQKWNFAPISLFRPKYLCLLIERLVFECLPPNVSNRLIAESKAPAVRDLGEFTYAQFQLDKHLQTMTVLLRAASNWTAFQRLFVRTIRSADRHAD